MEKGNDFFVNAVFYFVLGCLTIIVLIAFNQMMPLIDSIMEMDLPNILKNFSIVFGTFFLFWFLNRKISKAIREEKKEKEIKNHFKTKIYQDR